MAQGKTAGRAPTFPYFFRTTKDKGLGDTAKPLFFLPNLVGAIGLEPTTPTMSRWCSNQLSYAPGKAGSLAEFFAGYLRRALRTPLTCLTTPSTAANRAESVTSTVKVIHAVPLRVCVFTPITFIFSFANTSEMSRSRP